MADYQQTDTSRTSTCITGLFDSNASWLVQSAGTAGTVSHSSVVGSANADTNKAVSFMTDWGDPGTATIIGASTIRLNITTANSNIQAVGAHICESCQTGGTGTAATSTSGLGISFGTTGVKTASVELTTAYTFPKCGTQSMSIVLRLSLSNAAAMAATFNYKTDQVVTFSFTSSAAPAPSSIFTLAQMHVGH